MAVMTDGEITFDITVKKSAHVGEDGIIQVTN
jgi:hypothetical protein